jgi:hypothetical protein
MSAAGWQAVQHRMLATTLATTTTRTSNSGWHTRDIALLALAVALAAGVIVLLLARRPGHRTTS